MIQQWKKRVNVIQLIYSFLITNPDNEEFIKKILNDYDSIDSDQLKILEHFFEIKDSILIEVNKLTLNGWVFQRADLVIQAIIYEAIAEKECLNTDKNILIDQAIITAKNFCEENSSKFVNLILDKLL